MAKARWAKWRAEAHRRPEPEPKMVRAFALEFGVRHAGNESTAAWIPFRSVRDAARRLAVLQREYQAHYVQQRPTTAPKAPPALTTAAARAIATSSA